MTSYVKKWVLRPLLVLATLVVVLVGIGILFLEIEHDRIVHYGVKELNKRLTGELVFTDSKISLFKHFPYVSLGLHGVKLYPDKTGKSAPVCELESLRGGISLTDLLDKRYNLRKFSMRGGHIDLVRRKNGDLNMMEIFNLHNDTARSSPDTSNLVLDLQLITLKDLRLSFFEESDGRLYSTSIEELTSTLSMDSAVVETTLKSKMVLDMTSPHDTTFFRHKLFEIDVQANYEKSSSLLHIPSGSLKLQDATFNLSGSAHIARESVIDFRINGDKPDLNLITAFLPESVKKTLEPFQYDGHIYFDGMVRGRVAEDQMPLIEVDFGCKDAWFLNTGANQKVDQLGFKGYYYNGSEHALSTSELHITEVNARPGKGVFKGNFVMRDFTNPQIAMQVNSDLELKFVGEFFGIADLKQTTGKIQLDMDFQEIMDIKLPEESLRKLKEGVQSRLVVQNLSFAIPGHPLPVKNLNLQAEMKKGSITLDSASLRIGNSDLRIDGSLSDIQAFLRNHKKQVKVKLNARSRNLLLKDVFAYDTALQNKLTEEISSFRLGVEIQTTVEQLLNPAPLPKGQFDLKILSATLKNYKHSFKEISAEVTVNDTLVRLKNLKGMVDNSDFLFSGRVTNYQLWFDEIKKGKTQIAFDFKSKRFALDDILGRGTRKYVPRGYRHEEASDVWLRSKIDLRYDTVFRFAKAKVVNVTGFLKNHNFLMKDISGNVKYGANRILVLDTVKGMIGNSDFDVTMRIFNGADKTIKKRTNYFYFKSNFLDVDELVSYNFAPDTTRRRRSDSTRRSNRPRKPPVVAVKDTTSHAKSFNIFTLPFNEFSVRVDVAKLKYNNLLMDDLTARLRLTEDHFVHADTLATRIAGGYIGVNGLLDGRDTSRLLLTSHIRVDQLDLENVLLKLDHFGQDVLVNKNVKGKLSGSIRSSVQVHPNFVPKMSNSSATLNVRIVDGSLVDFAPMQAMAGYFKDKNLRLIRFDSLRNELTFNNGVLSIPSMNINSSLGSIEMSGKQSLDLSMEYYVRIPMKMVTQVGLNSLFDRKAGQVDAGQVDEIEYADKDRKTRFVNLKVTGTPSDFKVSLGKKKNRV